MHSELLSLPLWRAPGAFFHQAFTLATIAPGAGNLLSAGKPAAWTNAGLGSAWLSLPTQRHCWGTGLLEEAVLECTAKQRSTALRAQCICCSHLCTCLFTDRLASGCRLPTGRQPPLQEERLAMIKRLEKLVEKVSMAVIFSHAIHPSCVCVTRQAAGPAAWSAEQLVQACPNLCAGQAEPQRAGGRAKGHLPRRAPCPGQVPGLTIALLLNARAWGPPWPLM